METINRLFILFFLIFIMTGCNHNSTDQNCISIMYLSDLDLKYDELVNSPAKRFSKKLDEWILEHPDWKIDKQPRQQSTDVPTLARLGRDQLPDVFITDCRTGRLLAKEDYVLNMTDYLSAEDAESLYQKPFIYDGAIYAVPTLTKTYTTIIYNRAAWSKAGYDSFPSSWTELNKAAKTLRRQNKDYKTIIGIEKKSGSSVTRDFLSIMLSDAEGTNWFAKVIDGKKEISFTDPLFTKKLDYIQKTLRGKIFIGQEELSDNLMKAFIGGECPAVMLFGDDIRRLLEDVKKKDPELYFQLGFASLPLNDNQVMPAGCSSGLFINSRISEHPKKLEICIDLCKSLALNEEEYLMEDYPSDATIEQLHEYEKETNNCAICTQYLSNSFWLVARSVCFDSLSQDSVLSDDMITAREFTPRIQDAYEAYYLDIEDYSRKVRKYGK